MNDSFFMRWGVLLFAVVALVVSGCKPGGDEAAVSGDGGASAKLLRVVTTTTMVSDLVRIVAEDDVEVVALMSPGVDPHLFTLTARSTSDLKNADAVVYSGLGLEGKIVESFQSMSSNGIPVVALAESVSEEKRMVPEDAAGHPDPHVWGDVALWSTIVPEVAKLLAQLVPEKAAEFEKRAAAYQMELAKLHEWAVQRFKEVPQERRVLITSHDAFNYFGRAYGVEVLGLQGISTADEASLAGVAALVNTVKQRGIRAIFTESSVSAGPLKRVAADAEVALGGTLFSDSMGTPGDVVSVDGVSYDKGTYVGMIRHNVNTVVEGLK